ncbi:MAG: hypothetical protein ACLU4J_06405 [Butyricimonas paravirosa]
MAGEPTLLAKGLVEKIGLPVEVSLTNRKEKIIRGRRTYADHTAGIDLILKALVDPKLGR